MGLLKISVKNARYQQIEALLTNRNKRTRAGEFVVQGVRPINMALEHGWDITTLIYPSDRKLSEWAHDITQIECDKIAMTSELMNELSGKEDGSTEAIALVSLPADDLSRIPVPQDFLGVVFDRPTQPGNIGTIVRSADALGANGLIVTGHAADPYDPKAVRATTGSLFSLPVVRENSQEVVSTWVEQQRAAGVPIVVAATDEHGDTDVWDFDFTVPVLLLVGNETSGLSKAWREAADVTLSIPMTGSASSLNAGNAATLLMYEALRQRSARA
ncbi:TrmH family RNA methyltransferase [Populibacterium corticicola]|uniref:TrmH family RNA methyltransferase n=1 Tax=Populibacterium corticicola TaxID=1812826 RepID=A0ABW5X958_9MICO